MSDDLAKGEGGQRPEGGTGNGKRAKGKGDPWPARKRKAPQAETYGASKGNGEP